MTKLRLIDSKASNPKSIEGDKVPMGKDNRGPYGCTLREVAMCELLAAGKGIAESYRVAYDKPVRRNVHGDAQRVAARPRVQQYVMELREQNKGHELHDGVKARAFILDGIHTAIEETDDINTKLRAFELMGKLAHVAAFKEHISSEHSNRDEATIKSELKQRLTKLVG